MKSSISLSDQPVILEKPAFWSHIFLWMIMLVSTSAIVWAYFARIEQTVPAVGQLEFSDGAREIQAPTTGAVVRLHVENGDRVVKNQPLLTFSPTNPSADLKSLEEVKKTLEQEKLFSTL
jgi:HlyD family secretion protein